MRVINWSRISMPRIANPVSGKAMPNTRYDQGKYGKDTFLLLASVARRAVLKDAASTT